MYRQREGGPEKENPRLWEGRCGCMYTNYNNTSTSIDLQEYICAYICMYICGSRGNKSFDESERHEC